MNIILSSGVGSSTFFLDKNRSKSPPPHRRLGGRGTFNQVMVNEKEYLPTTQYLPDPASHGLSYQYGNDWAEGDLPPSGDPAVRLQMCIDFSSRHDYKTALQHARAARVMLQEALVTSIEQEGDIPLLLVSRR